jgi:hypothetical protein
VLVAQNIELTLELADDIVIPSSGSAVFTDAARDLEMNGAIVTQHPGVHWVSSRTSRSDNPGSRDRAAVGPGYFASAEFRDDRNPG